MYVVLLSIYLAIYIRQMGLHSKCDLGSTTGQHHWPALLTALASSIGRHQWSAPLAGIIGQDPWEHVPNRSMLMMTMMMLMMTAICPVVLNFQMWSSILNSPVKFLVESPVKFFVQSLVRFAVKSLV